MKPLLAVPVGYLLPAGMAASCSPRVSTCLVIAYEPAAFFFMVFFACCIIIRLSPFLVCQEFVFKSQALKTCFNIKSNQSIPLWCCFCYCLWSIFKTRQDRMECIATTFPDMTSLEVARLVDNGHYSRETARAAALSHNQRPSFNTSPYISVRREYFMPFFVLRLDLTYFWFKVFALTG